MALRADQWMAITIGGIALGALYLLTRAESTPAPGREPIYKPNGNGTGPVTEPPVEPVDGPINTGIPPGSMLRPSWYRGRFELADTPDMDRRSDAETTLSSLSTRGEIASHLRDLGFADVTVYMNVDEATPAILIPDRLAGPTRGSRWFAARWVGVPGQAASPLQRSRRFKYLWFAAGAPTLGIQTLAMLQRAAEEARLPPRSSPRFAGTLVGRDGASTGQTRGSALEVAPTARAQVTDTYAQIDGTTIHPPYFYTKDGPLYTEFTRQIRDGSRIVPPGTLVRILDGPYGPWPGRHGRAGTQPRALRVYKVEYIGKSYSKTTGQTFPRQRVEGWIDARDLRSVAARGYA